MIELTDLMLTVSGIGFFLSLLPAIRDSFRGRTTITLLASVPTAALLVLTATAVFMLGQVFAGWTTLLTATAWAFLAFRRWGEEDEFDMSVPGSWMEGYMACDTREERHKYFHETQTEHYCPAWESLEEETHEANTR